MFSMKFEHVVYMPNLGSSLSSNEKGNRKKENET